MANLHVEKVQSDFHDQVIDVLRKELWTELEGGCVVLVDSLI